MLIWMVRHSYYEFSDSFDGLAKYLFLFVVNDTCEQRQQRQSHISQTPLCMLQTLNVTGSAGFRINGINSELMKGNAQESHMTW